MAQRLEGKVALVTAAGQGIGRGIAQAFVGEGARVIATDVDESKLDGLACEKGLKLDVRSTPAVEALATQIAAEYAALDVLVNCAGYVHHGNVLDCAEHGLGLLVRPQCQVDAPHDQGLPPRDAAQEGGARSSTSRPRSPRSAVSPTATPMPRPRLP